MIRSVSGRSTRQPHTPSSCKDMKEKPFPRHRSEQSRVSEPDFCRRTMALYTALYKLSASGRSASGESSEPGVRLRPVLKQPTQDIGAGEARTSGERASTASCAASEISSGTHSSLKLPANMPLGPIQSVPLTEASFWKRKQSCSSVPLRLVPTTCRFVRRRLLPAALQRSSSLMGTMSCWLQSPLSSFRRRSPSESRTSPRSLPAAKLTDDRWRNLRQVRPTLARFAGASHAPALSRAPARTAADSGLAHLRTRLLCPAKPSETRLYRGADALSGAGIFG
mmetsp:Transcript_62684/g.186856  ORF Transcript_62684/g.186856 Transcript_62684/m.186856 type:complete len:281 (-) Transcript_62684:33-875(-)